MTKALKKDWESAYIDLAVQGYLHSDMPSSNHVWDAYLRDNGYSRYIMPNFCPDCYTIRQFCYDHPKGIYILATGTHVVTAVDGDYYDTWDSGNSMRGRYYRDGYYRDGYARDGSYEGNSYRKRNRMGQFSRYSREGEPDKLVEKLETLMDDTTNGGDREKIRNQIMEVMNKYK